VLAASICALVIGTVLFIGCWHQPVTTAVLLGALIAVAGAASGGYALAVDQTKAVPAPAPPAPSGLSGAAPTTPPSSPTASSTTSSTLAPPSTDGLESTIQVYAGNRQLGSNHVVSITKTVDLAVPLDGAVQVTVKCRITDSRGTNASYYQVAFGDARAVKAG
jgi:hypothetical protein